MDDLAVAEGRRYIVPLKTAVRKAERLELGDEVTIRLVVGT